MLGKTISNKPKIRRNPHFLYVQHLTQIPLFVGSASSFCNPEHTQVDVPFPNTQAAKSSPGSYSSLAERTCTQLNVWINDLLEHIMQNHQVWLHLREASLQRWTWSKQTWQPFHCTPGLSELRSHLSFLPRNHHNLADKYVPVVWTSAASPAWMRAELNIAFPVSWSHLYIPSLLKAVGPYID